MDSGCRASTGIPRSPTKSLGSAVAGICPVPAGEIEGHRDRTKGGKDECDEQGLQAFHGRVDV